MQPQVVTLNVNGRQHHVALAPNVTLLQALRDLGYTDVKNGCEKGDCGACAVLLNGEPVNSCLVLAWQADGAEIITDAGLGTMDNPHPLQAAFADAGAVQCGYCTPGMIVAAKALLDRNPHPTEDEIREAISGNLCRCTGYGQIIEAIQRFSDSAIQRFSESASRRVGESANERVGEWASRRMGESIRRVRMTYEEWEAEVHERVKRESTWQFLGYRKALFFYDLVWQDCERLTRDRRGRAIAEQLIRSAGSISANIEEGHGRGYGKQRNWFFTVSIGSARESKGWYWRARRLLSAKVLEHRLALADEVIALLVTELAHQRSR